MVEITNVKVYDLRESVIACRNAMRTEPAEYTDEEFEKSLERAVKLAKCNVSSGECNFLKGCLVSYDIKYPGYFAPELQRYGFNTIVCSSSKMHRLRAMAGNPKHYNKYVGADAIKRMKAYVETYNNNPTYENFMRLVSNCPMGIELFMHCTTNYMALRNIYHQRKHHALKDDWGAFCKFIEELPYFKEFINPE